jgi:hypothetical protein
MAQLIMKMGKFESDAPEFFHNIFQSFMQAINKVSDITDLNVEKLKKDTALAEINIKEKLNGKTTKGVTDDFDYEKESNKDVFDHYLPVNERPTFFPLKDTPVLNEIHGNHLKEYLKCRARDPEEKDVFERDSSSDPENENIKIINLGAFKDPSLGICNKEIRRLTATTIFVANKQKEVFQQGCEFFLKLKRDDSPKWYTCIKSELYRYIDENVFKSMFSGKAFNDDREMLQVRLKITFKRENNEDESYDIEELRELNTGSTYDAKPPFKPESIHDPVYLIKKRCISNGGKKTKRTRCRRRKTNKKGRRHRSSVRRK